MKPESVGSWLWQTKRKGGTSYSEWLLQENSAAPTKGYWRWLSQEVAPGYLVVRDEAGPPGRAWVFHSFFTFHSAGIIEFSAPLPSLDICKMLLLTRWQMIHIQKCLLNSLLCAMDCEWGSRQVGKWQKILKNRRGALTIFQQSCNSNR